MLGNRPLCCQWICINRLPFLLIYSHVYFSLFICLVALASKSVWIKLFKFTKTFLSKPFSALLIRVDPCFFVSWFLFCAEPHRCSEKAGGRTLKLCFHRFCASVCFDEIRSPGDTVHLLDSGHLDRDTGMTTSQEGDSGELVSSGDWECISSISVHRSHWAAEIRLLGCLNWARYFRLILFQIFFIRSYHLAFMVTATATCATSNSAMCHKMIGTISRCRPSLTLRFSLSFCFLPFLFYICVLRPFVLVGLRMKFFFGVSNFQCCLMLCLNLGGYFLSTSFHSSPVFFFLFLFRPSLHRIIPTTARWTEKTCRSWRRRMLFSVGSHVTSFACAFSVVVLTEYPCTLRSCLNEKVNCTIAQPVCQKRSNELVCNAAHNSKRICGKVGGDELQPSERSNVLRNV